MPVQMVLKKIDTLLEDAYQPPRHLRCQKKKKMAQCFRSDIIALSGGGGGGEGGLRA